MKNNNQNPHYLELMRQARKDHLANIRNVSNEIAALYEDAAKDLADRARAAPKGSLNQRWAAEYSRSLSRRAAELRAGLYETTYQGLKRAAEIPSIADGDFWEVVGWQSFRDAFASPPDDVLTQIISGGFYKDHKGLSERIWRSADEFEKDIGYIVNRGIAEHKSAVELAKDLEQYVKDPSKRSWDWNRVYPNLRGKKVDYNAQRLARTAINHSYFLSNQKICRRNPYVEAMHWELSPEHDERQVKPFGPDECDDYAAHDEGLGIGNFPPETIPVPHPQCLCAQWGVITKSLEEIGAEIGDWIAGKSNSTLDSWYDKYGHLYGTGNENFNKNKLISLSNGGKIISGGLNPLTGDSKERDRIDEHAERYYASVRKMKTDVARIAKNTGYDEELIQEIKKFVFLEEHDLGDGEPKLFYPDFMMAQSWQRLIDGKNIQSHDLTLLKHEKMERELMQQGYSQKDAHDMTEEKYNYHKEAKAYYAEINKHKKE